VNLRIILLFATLTVQAAAQSGPPRSAAETFPLSEVQLLDSQVKQNIFGRAVLKTNQDRTASHMDSF
jgi:hypothetical protein